MSLFRLCSRDGGRRRLGGGGGGGLHYDPTPGITRPTEDGKRRLIRGEGFASRVSGTVRPQDPGGGATSVAAPRLMKTDDISDTAELFKGGGGLPCSPPESRWCWSRRPVLGTLHDRSVHVTIKRGSPIAGMNGPLGGTVSEGDTRSPCGGGGGGGATPPPFRYCQEAPSS